MTHEIIMKEEYWKVKKQLLLLMKSERIEHQFLKQKIDLYTVESR